MREEWKIRLRHPLLLYGLSVAAVVLAYLCRLALQWMLGEALPSYILLYPTVILVALLGGFWPGILATLLAVVVEASNLPRSAGLHALPVNLVGQTIFLCAGYAMSVVADLYREARDRAEVYKKQLALRESQAALERSRERLRVTLSSIGDGVISCDEAGRIAFMNSKAEELTGWNSDEAENQPIDTVLRVVDEKTGRPMEYIPSQLLSNGGPVRLGDHVALIHKDGISFPIEYSAAPILDGAEQLTGAVLVFRSVSEQRLAQEMLRASERRYRTLVETSPDAVVVHLHGKIVYANPVAVKLLGAKYREELQGHQMLDMIHRDWREAVRERMQLVQAGGLAPLRELRIVQLGGTEVVVESTAGAVDWQGQTAVQSILRDITARKAAEGLYVQTEKLASVGRMAASIAHEINNPLAAVMNTIYLARKTPDVPPAAAEYLAIAEEELKRVSHITRQVLGFYRESSVWKRVKVDTVMDSALDLLQSKIRYKRASIERQYRGDLEIMACAGELRQVFSNLVANSLECMDEGGMVRLRITGRRSRRSGEHTVRITVSDTGPGVPKAVRPRIFEALFTTKADTGTGLGLWVSKQIVEKHGGSIRFRSSATGARTGTVFSIVLRGAAGMSAAADSSVASQHRSAS